MIIQSPESTMCPPFDSYVKQRNESIAKVLKEVVGDNNVQLCPRAIMPDEKVFDDLNSHIYGVVVENINHGYKSALYSPEFDSCGIATANMDEAISYVNMQLAKGNRTRIKDPRESDSQGQYTIESIDQLLPIFNEIATNNETGCILMPHLDKITHRISVGRIALKGIGNFTYLGLEDTTLREGDEVYGGTTLGLYHSTSNNNETRVEKYFKIPHELVILGKTALDKYQKMVISNNRVSVDVIEGFTDNGEVFKGVIDITPRVGGTTPAETLAISAVHKDSKAICYSSSRLLYNPTTRPDSGINFIDTDSLIINAKIHKVN